MRAAFVAAAIAACLLVAGCGDSESTTATGESSAPDTSTSTTAEIEDTYTITRCNPPGCDLDEEARDSSREVLELYFEGIGSGDASAAWELLSPEVQEQFGGFDTWSSGIEARESTELASVQDAGGSGGAPAFEVEVRTVETTPCGITADRTFTGTWTVRVADFKIAAVDQRLVSGPPDLETLCATGGY